MTHRHVFNKGGLPVNGGGSHNHSHCHTVIVILIVTHMQWLQCVELYRDSVLVHSHCHSHTVIVILIVTHTCSGYSV
jgi:hypothetical protein